MWLSAALARQEDPTDSIRVPILINCWGRLEPCVEDSEARSEPASIVINAGISCSVGWEEHLCQVLTSPIPSALHGQTAMPEGHLLFRDTWAISSLTTCF